MAFVEFRADASSAARQSLRPGASFARLQPAASPARLSLAPVVGRIGAMDLLAWSREQAEAFGQWQRKLLGLGQIGSTQAHLRGGHGPVPVNDDGGACVAGTVALGIGAVMASDYRHQVRLGHAPAMVMRGQLAKALAVSVVGAGLLGSGLGLSSPVKGAAPAMHWAADKQRNLYLGAMGFRPGGTNGSSSSAMHHVAGAGSPSQDVLLFGGFCLCVCGSLIGTKEKHIAELTPKDKVVGPASIGTAGRGGGRVTVLKGETQSLLALYAHFAAAVTPG